MIQAIRYIESFINYEKIPVYPYEQFIKLERIREFLRLIGNPQDYLRCIHVAGSKGKGSTCVFIAYILRAAGYKVGLYTSPHLSDFRERIRVLQIACRKSHAAKPEFEGMISKREFVNLVRQLKPAIDRFNKHSQYGPLSFFEVYTALALYYFNKKKTDIVVLETGLGGRLDATNVVDPLVAVITPISLEHTDKLGNTLVKIAGEKAGIIKVLRSRIPLPVVCAPQEKDAFRVIKNRCSKTGARLIYVKKPDPKLKINLIGSHQSVNATVAKTAVEALSKIGYKIGVDKIKSGLNDTIWPGRCEVVSYNPTVVLDGAQNEASAKVLAEVIKSNFSYRKLILVLGISSDKDIKGICRRICPLADIIILTKADTPRAATIQQIENDVKKCLSDCSKQIIYTNGVREAKKKAFLLADKKDLILATGSLFVVGEFRNGKI
ncbi:MAG: bifunctional folylpolyglutamate synthase/dihydrofolate synthase [Candidatus Omnitrophica bacterium]|nr:bifunctional folylpolyglutamate synthase/dihydrofolate synthase [Candidatus Omnitrophota bacterium]